MGSVDEISEAIGNLRAQSISLSLQMVALSAQVERSFKVSTETHDNVHGLKDTVANMGADLESMRPVVEKVKRWEQRALAVAGVGAFVGSVFWERLFSMVKGWLA